MTNTAGLTYTPLHPTFVAEVHGADFDNITPQLADDIKKGLAQYGVLVFRNTGLDDDRHVALSRLMGELDDVTPYNKLGRVNRLKYDELFDVSNVDADGNIIQPGSQRDILGKGEYSYEYNLHRSLPYRQPAVSSDFPLWYLMAASMSTRHSTPAAPASHFSSPTSSHQRARAVTRSLLTHVPPMTI